MATSQPIIQVENLTAAFDDAVVLRDVSFEVYPGEAFLVVGRSGCGKTTLLKHMIGLLQPVSGRVVIDGDDVTRLAGPERTRLLRKFGVTFQTGALFGSMTLLENVRLGLEEFTDLPREAIDLIATMKLDLVGLRDARHRMPAEISGGMQKRAAIARAIAMDPRILFMDEPAAGLDPVTLASFDQLILDLAHSLQMTFVIVTHELTTVFSVADRVIMLDKDTRTVAAAGTPEELSRRNDNPAVWDFFHQTDQPRSRRPNPPPSEELRP